MKNIFKYAMLSVAAFSLSTGFTACGNDDDDDDIPANNGTVNTNYTDKHYGQDAIDACADVVSALEEAYNALAAARLSDEQTASLKAILANDVDNVIVPTYRALGDAVEKMHTALGTLSSSQVTQQNVNDACDAFKTARAEWEKSEAFLMGPAAGFDIDPHIDSWPLDRAALHDYFKNPNAEDLDESILGFHALEFILFRDGQPRKVEEFRGNDSYKGFTDITGAQELQYAESVIADLLNHVYELEVAWNPSNATRLNAVKAAGLEYETPLGKDFGYNLKNAGDETTSTFPTLLDALHQVLSADEESCVGIANEVGTAKIANPFSNGYIFYVESPYSYNSIKDFQDNIRSIENTWYGGRNGKSSNVQNSFHQFFAANNPSLGKKVEDAIEDAISKIGAMPAPFVKYVSTIWNKTFEDDPVIDLEEE